MPPAEVYDDVDGAVRERHDFELRDGEVLDAARDALRDEPEGLQQGPC